jgi:hypothetical protein
VRSWPCRRQSKPRHCPTIRAWRQSCWPPSPNRCGSSSARYPRHRLRREIIATKLANRLVNRLGLIHPFELAEEEGASLAQTAAAFVAAEQLFGLAETWQRIETAPMSEGARIMLFDRAAAALSDHIADLLRIGGHTCEPSKLVAELQGGVAELTRNPESLLSLEVRAQSGRMRSALAEAGAPEAEAALVVQLQDVDGSIGIARLARETGCTARAITAAFGDLGHRRCCPPHIRQLRTNRSRPIRLIGDPENRGGSRVIQRQQVGQRGAAQFGAGQERHSSRGALGELVPRADRQAIVAAVDAVAHQRGTRPVTGPLCSIVR